MKTTRFLFTSAGFGVLTLGLSFAGEPSGPPPRGPSEGQAASKPPAGQAQGNPARDHRSYPDGTHSKSKEDSQAGPTRKTMPAHRPGPNRPKQAAIGREEPGRQRADNPPAQRTPANGLPPPGLSKPATAAKDGLRLNPMGNQRQPPARLPVGSATTALLPGIVRGRGAAPATIGGLTASSARSSTAAINGAAMKRRP
jgi:hypothetical protein